MEAAETETMVRLTQKAQSKDDKMNNSLLLDEDVSGGGSDIKISDRDRLGTVLEDVKTQRPSDEIEERLRLRVRELEAQVLVEDRLRVRIRDMENELAMRKERTEQLGAAINNVMHHKWATSASAAASNHSSTRHVLWNLLSASITCPSMHDIGHANDTFSFIVDDAQSNHLRPQYVMPEDVQGELQPSTVSRSSSAESLESYPNKKQRHN